MDGAERLLDQVLPSAAYRLARAFAQGATMWCVAPEWPAHARHLAVEFVHPVVVGARALPAVSVPGPDPVAALRASVRPGDVLAVLSPASHGVAVELVRRAPVWGATTLWLATGSGPLERADLTVSIDDPAGTAAHDGRLVLHYHLLWELTHVCFEHPGLLEPARSGEDDDVVCVTCRDEGRLAEVVRVAASGHDVEVRTAEGREHADATLVAALETDDLVLVHAGSVIARVSGS